VRGGVVVALRELAAALGDARRERGVVEQAANGAGDGVAVDRLRQYEEDLYRFLENSHPTLLSSIAEKKILDDDIKKALGDALTQFGKQFGA